MDKITSRQNPRVKFLTGLHNRKKRKETGETILEGPNLVSEAIKNGIVLLEVMATENFLQKIEIIEPERVTVVTEEVMAKIAPSRTPQGIVARIENPSFSLKEVLQEEFLLVLEGLRDPGNVGTLIRTAAGAGFGGVVLLRNGADPYQPKSLRASTGAIFQVKVNEVNKSEEEQFLSELKKRFKVFKAETRGGKDYRQVEFFSKTALILGHETKGISLKLDDPSFVPVSIPLNPGVESLNVAAAGAILLFAIKHRKSTDLPTS